MTGQGILNALLQLSREELQATAYIRLPFGTPLPSNAWAEIGGIHITKDVLSGEARTIDFYPETPQPKCITPKSE